MSQGVGTRNTHALVRAVTRRPSGYIVSTASVHTSRGYAYDGDALLWSTHCGYSYSTPCIGKAAEAEKAAAPNPNPSPSPSPIALALALTLAQP